MIRTNLIKRESVRYGQAGKLINPFLALVLFFQIIALGMQYGDSTALKEKYFAAEQRLATLKAETDKYRLNENLQDLAGKVAERNNWLTDRKNSSLNKLAKLQKDCPNNVRFLSYNADLTSGKITLTAPDLNSVSSWLNSHFSNRGNISVTGRENKLLMIQYVWSG
jgi:hypothetical protein